MKDKGFGGADTGGSPKPPVFCGFSDELPPNPLSIALVDCATELS
jgi:hypothetical protein